MSDRFITLEEFIIDTFTKIEDDGTEHPSDKPDEIGGGGTYTTNGARIFLPSPRIGLMIHHSPETMPMSMKAKLLEYGEDMFDFIVRQDGHGTVRAVNKYKREFRIFEYLTAPIFYTLDHLLHSRFIEPLPAVIHMIVYPPRGLEILGQIKRVGTAKGQPNWQPLVLCEPELTCCNPENIEVFREIAADSDVFSPNHTEALGFTGLTFNETSALSRAQLVEAIERATLLLASWKPRRAAIIRAGALGACYVDTTSASGAMVKVEWIPPYWQAGSEDKIVDPTGAGNSFMGGCGAALMQGHDVREAVLWATVAASFTIEQSGLPTLDKREGVELWNGDVPRERIETLRHRLAAV